MAPEAMLALFLSTTLASFAWSFPQADAAPATSLDAVVLEFGDRKITAREVVERSAAEDAPLRGLLENDPSYRAVFLASPRFQAAVRDFADLLRLDELGVAQVDQEALEREARAYIADRNSKLSVDGMLRTRPLRIEVRARLLTQQASSFTSNELRLHMLRSVPEFFGEMQISWIRVPLVELEKARALTEEEARAVYNRLDEAARLLQNEELSWKEAVAKYCQDPTTKARDGAVGLVQRTMTDRFEEPMLRQLFADLGHRMLEGKLLRGPILAEKWAYLIRIEAMRIDGVPELQRARDRVERSLRESLLQEQLRGIRQVLPAKILAPILPR